MRKILVVLGILAVVSGGIWVWQHWQELSPSGTGPSGEFHKVALLRIGWVNYNNFSVKEVTIQYGVGPNPYQEGPMTVKIYSKNGEPLTTYTMSDPREDYRYCAMCPPGIDCPPCPPPKFLKDGEFLLIQSLDIVYDTPTKTFDFRGARSIELYEPEKLPEWAFPEGETFPGYTPGELLLRIDLSEYADKFCKENAVLENDPFCD